MFEQEGYDLMAAAFEVYNSMGSGFLEEVYQESLEIELNLRGIPFERQPLLNIYYKNNKLDKFYRPDLYVFGGIVVELKAMKQLTSIQEAQIMNYLRASNMKVGYLINWGNESKLEWKRFVV